MLPKCLESYEELKMVELWGEQSSRRRGWITLVQIWMLWIISIIYEKKLSLFFSLGITWVKAIKPLLEPTYNSISNAFCTMNVEMLISPTLWAHKAKNKSTLTWHSITSTYFLNKRRTIGTVPSLKIFYLNESPRSDRVNEVFFFWHLPGC